jgi:hypothetical protein
VLPAGVSLICRKDQAGKLDNDSGGADHENHVHVAAAAGRA